MQPLNQEIYRKIWLLVPSWKIGSAGALGPPSHPAAAVQVGRLWEGCIYPCGLYCLSPGVGVGVKWLSKHSPRK